MIATTASRMAHIRDERIANLRAIVADLGTQYDRAVRLEAGTGRDHRRQEILGEYLRYRDVLIALEML